MFVTNWISTTKIQKISEITNFFRHYFLSRTEVPNTIVARTEESKICFLDSCNVSVIMLALFYFVYTILVYFSVGKDRAFCVMLFLEMDFFFS